MIHEAVVNANCLDAAYIVMENRHETEKIGVPEAGYMSNEVEMVSAAFHESSHAVAAWKLGAKVGELSIECPRGVWTGNCPTSFNEGPGPERKKKIIQIAVAGPFGQLKHRALQRWNRVSFCPEWSLASFVKIIRSGEIPLDNRLWLGFLTDDGIQRELPVADLNDIGDLEMLSVVSSEFTDVTIVGLIREAGLLLDAHWDKVEKLANTLIRRLNVTSEDFRNLIDSPT